MSNLTEIKALMDSLDSDELREVIRYADEINPDPFTPIEVIEAINKATRNDPSEFFYDPSYYELTLRGRKIKCEEVSRTGGMDEGSQLSVVFTVGSQTFKKDGYYASHYGSDWDGDMYEVKGEPKTVTVYERV